MQKSTKVVIFSLVLHDLREIVECKMGCKKFGRIFLRVHNPVKPETGWVKNLLPVQIFNA